MQHANNDPISLFAKWRQLTVRYILWIIQHTILICVRCTFLSFHKKAFIPIVPIVVHDSQTSTQINTGSFSLNIKYVLSSVFFFLWHMQCFELSMQNDSIESSINILYVPKRGFLKDFIQICRILTTKMWCVFYISFFLQLVMED